MEAGLLNVTPSGQQLPNKGCLVQKGHGIYTAGTMPCQAQEAELSSRSSTWNAIQGCAEVVEGAMMQA